MSQKRSGREKDLRIPTTPERLAKSVLKPPRKPQPEPKRRG